MKATGSYVKLMESGELKRRTEKAVRQLAECRLCPHECGVNRLDDEKGFCRIGRKAIVATYGAHFGEEPPITGRNGSGTVFFSGCNMRCLYCQNYEISHGLEGSEAEREFLAFAFLYLQEGGCHNINLVTPSHVVPQILEGLLIAAEEGLTIPIVYNCGGYDSLSTLRLLDGIVDIYMPDMKYADDKTAFELSRVKDYWRLSRQAVKEMFRQVGRLTTDRESGAAARGLLIRHLVLPGGLSNTREICRFIAEELSADTVVNIMDQYRPCGQAARHPPLDRRITREEYGRALKWAEEAGLTDLLRF